MMGSKFAARLQPASCWESLRSANTIFVGHFNGEYTLVVVTRISA